MNILFVHPSFPGQFVYLASYLAKNPENHVMFLAKENMIGVNLEGVELGLYTPPDEKEVKAAGEAGDLQPAAEAVLEGRQTVRSLYVLKQKKDFVPDVIVGHTGWGSLLYVKDVYPDVPVLGYFEWYYHAMHSDSFWWPDEVPTIDMSVQIRTKNAHHLLSLEACDAGYTPTEWQYKQFPAVYQPKLQVIHDGIDTDFCRPAAERPGLVLEDAGLDLPAGTEIITYVARGFEMFRGFPYFMDALRLVLRERPEAHVVLVGADRVCYGPSVEGMSYREFEEKKGGYDASRVHFVGTRNRGDYQKILQASSVHVYLTRPFILSWSMLEAMSFGCALVASKTPPVQEVVTDGTDALLAEFRSPHHIARRIIEVLDDPALAKRLGKAARETVLRRYSLRKCLRAQEDLIYSLVK